jgi:hypothetical protein
VGGGVQLGPFGTSVKNWPIVRAPGDYDDGGFGGMKIGRGSRSTWRKPTQAPHCPPQISLDQTRDRTRAAEMGKPETKYLSYGAALAVIKLQDFGSY